jgi:hypothetical protein
MSAWQFTVLPSTRAVNARFRDVDYFLCGSVSALSPEKPNDDSDEITYSSLWHIYLARASS